MNLNDNRLIIKTLKSGDQKVFSLVYASYYKPLCLFCSSYVSLEEAEEIVQDLMMYGKHSASCVFFSPLFLPTFVASL